MLYTDDMREFIRHPVDIPVEIVPGDESESHIDKLVNLSYGGIAFHSLVEFLPGQTVDVNIVCVTPFFKAQALVKWCRVEGDGFDVGVKFSDPNDQFRARMVEQVCYIEQYKNEMLKQGRELTGEQAAMEWIERFATQFPGNDDNNE